MLTYHEDLEVHRLIPGTVYHADFCISLCVACHAKKVRRLREVLWSKDLWWLGFNLYDEDDAALFARIKEEAAALKIPLCNHVTNILREHFRQKDPDYSI